MSKQPYFLKTFKKKGACLLPPTYNSSVQPLHHLSDYTGSGSVSQTERLKSRNRKFFKSQNFLTQDMWFDLKRLSAFKLCPIGYQ